MAKVIDMAGVKRADALVADALRCNPHVLDRLTIGDIEMVFNEEAAEDKTVLVTIRVPRPLLEAFDESVREQAYLQKKRITRNSSIVDLIAGAVDSFSASRVLSALDQKEQKNHV